MKALHDMVADQCNFTGTIEINGAERQYKNGKVISRERNTTALVGFLAAKLACHAPDDSAVQWALEWLNARS